MIGSWACSKAARSIVGKSELEKNAEQEAQNKAVEAYNDPKKLQELVDAYDKMLNEREEMVQESYLDNLENTCPQDNTYVAKEPVLDINM